MRGEKVSRVAVMLVKRTTEMLQVMRRKTQITLYYFKSKPKRDDKRKVSCKLIVGGKLREQTERRKKKP